MGKYTHTLEDSFNSKIQNIIEKGVLMNLKLNVKIKKLEGFNDQEFIKVLSKLLCEVGVDNIQYSILDDGYVFVLHYNVYIPSYPVQPILGSIQEAATEYGKVQIISIPVEEIEIIND